MGSENRCPVHAAGTCGEGHSSRIRNWRFLKCVKIREFYEFFKIRKMRILELWGGVYCCPAKNVTFSGENDTRNFTHRTEDVHPCPAPLATPCT